MTPLSTTGRCSTDPSHDPPDAGRFSHASETMSAYMAGPAAGFDGDRPGIPDPVRLGTYDRTRTAGPHGTTGTFRRSGSRSGGPGCGPRVARGRTSLGPTGLGTAGDDIRPRSPGRGPHRGSRHTGTGRRTGPGVVRGQSRGTRSGLSGTDRHGHPTSAHDIRSGAGNGGEGRRSRDGRGTGHRGTRQPPLPDVMPALGPTQRKDLPGPTVTTATLATEQGPVPLAAGGRGGTVTTSAVDTRATTTALAVGMRPPCNHPRCGHAAALQPP